MKTFTKKKIICGRDVKRGKNSGNEVSNVEKKMDYR
jgi:hypothetical protein